MAANPDPEKTVAPVPAPADFAQPTPPAINPLDAAIAQQNATGGQYAPATVPPANPYDVNKVLGPAPDFAKAFGPPPVAEKYDWRTGTFSMPSFIESTGGGQGMGHFATQADVQAHHDAAQAAAGYLQAAAHLHDLHNKTQSDIDTGAVLHNLIGKTDPNEIADILAQNPNYDVNHVHPIIANMMERAKEKQAFLSKYNLQQQKIDARDTLSKDLKAQNLTPSDLIFQEVKAGNFDKGKFTPKTEAEGATHIELVDDKGKKVHLPVKQYHDWKNQALEARGMGGATEPAPAPKLGEINPATGKPTTFAERQAALSTVPKPAGSPAPTGTPAPAGGTKHLGTYNPQTGQFEK
jgi:hypothetical protein